MSMAGFDDGTGALMARSVSGHFGEGVVAGAAGVVAGAAGVIADAAGVVAAAAGGDPGPGASLTQRKPRCSSALSGDAAMRALGR